MAVAKIIAKIIAKEIPNTELKVQKVENLKLRINDLIAELQHLQTEIDARGAQLDDN